MSEYQILQDRINSFDEEFSTDYENLALTARGEFIRRFPLNKLSEMTLDNYVIGKGAPTFCAMVEAKTKAWANIQGATSSKFGVYYGVTKSDSEKKYRATRKFGGNVEEAFTNVKKALIDLIDAGKVKNFRSIDENPLSQMFKAKILSLYLPDAYINICSKDHLRDIARSLEIPIQNYISAYQAALIEKKKSNDITEGWSNPKYMSLLYSNLSLDNTEKASDIKISEPNSKNRPRVNFEDIEKNRREIGKISEKYALDWEEKRLFGIGHESLIKRIKDRTDRPSYGYDFLSYSSPGVSRYIEVKSIGRDRGNNCYRFYLSENEKIRSLSKELNSEYYFYLVFYNSDGEPCNVIVRSANQLYEIGDVIPCNYEVRFEKVGI